LFDAIAARTRQHVSRWDDTLYVSFADILNSQSANEATYMAPDDHPNAEGHEQIARFLISRIDTILQIRGDET
jgi:lysophospholipase L1-like esterase